MNSQKSLRRISRECRVIIRFEAWPSMSACIHHPASKRKLNGKPVRSRLERWVFQSLCETTVVGELRSGNFPRQKLYRQQDREPKSKSDQRLWLTERLREKSERERERIGHSGRSGRKSWVLSPMEVIIGLCYQSWKTLNPGGWVQRSAPDLTQVERAMVKKHEPMGYKQRYLMPNHIQNWEGKLLLICSQCKAHRSKYLMQSRNDHIPCLESCC